MHCVRAVHHEVVVLFIGWLLRRRTHPWFAFADLWLRNMHCVATSKHLSNLTLHACSACLPPQRQHCCPDACWLCFPNLLTCLGYLPSLCIWANFTRLTFSLRRQQWRRLGNETAVLYHCHIYSSFHRPLESYIRHIAEFLRFSPVTNLSHNQRLRSGKFAWTVNFLIAKL